MTAVAVARGFVNDAMSKMVSSVIGSAGVGDPSRPGSPASLRSPYACLKTTVPPCPIRTTAPGSLCAASASLITLDTGAKSNAGLGAAGAGGGAATGGRVVGAGLAVVVTAVCAAVPLEHAATNTTTAAMAMRAEGVPSTCRIL